MVALEPWAASAVIHDTRDMRGEAVPGPGAGRLFEAAVPAGEDPGRYASVLRQIRDAALAGARPPATPRPLIDDSWRRAPSCAAAQSWRPAPGSGVA